MNHGTAQNPTLCVLWLQLELDDARRALAAAQQAIRTLRGGRAMTPADWAAAEPAIAAAERARDARRDEGSGK